MLSGTVYGLWLLKFVPHYVESKKFGVVNGLLVLLMNLPYLDLGYRTTINRRILAEPSETERLLLVQFSQLLYRRISLVLLPTVLVGMALYSRIGAVRTAGEPISFFLLMGLGGAALTLVSAQTNLLVGLGQQRRLFQINAMTSCLNLTVVWVGLQNGLDLWVFPLSLLIAATVQGLVAWYFCLLANPGFQLLGSIDKGQFQRLLRDLTPEAIACFRGQLSIIFLFSIDVTLASNLGTSNAAAASGGPYGTAARLFAQARNLLQSGSETMWPIIARFNQSSKTSGEGAQVAHLSEWLLRMNAWVYGGALGAILVVASPFLGWWTRNSLSSWTPDQLLITLMCVRFFITGISSPAAFYLIGMGKFSVLAKYTERELVAAVLLALPLGYFHHGEGVAAAFLVATVFGTLTPIFWAWARNANLNPVEWYFKILMRALMAAATSGTVAWLVLNKWGTTWQTIPAAATGVVATAAVGLLWVHRRPPPVESGFLGKWPRLANL